MRGGNTEPSTDFIVFFMLEVKHNSPVIFQDQWVRLEYQWLVWK